MVFRDQIVLLEEWHPIPDLVDSLNYRLIDKSSQSWMSQDKI